MNKLGWFVNGATFGLLLALTFFGYYNDFTNDFVFPYVFGIISFGLNFCLFKEEKQDE